MPATRKKKKFIDKKNAVTFHLVHRSQKDPLQADEEAGQRVLLPHEAASLTSTAEKRREEQQKYGVFFDDDYNYMQHLRDVDELYQVEPLEYSAPAAAEPRIHLPSSVFGSTTETDIGLLNKAVPLKGPQPDWDPDIVAALDDDFNLDDPDNVLEDDFVIQANQDGFGAEEEEEGRSDDGSEDSIQGFASDEADVDGEMWDTFDPDNFDRFADEETKSRFTNYSMSSSVIRRNNGLTFLDDQFEHMFKEYDEDEIGALDHQEIDGNIPQNSHLLTDAMDDFETKYSSQTTLKEVVKKTDSIDIASDSESDHSEQMVKMVLEEKPEKAWDCESILSTYSNLYNHPKTIEEPKKRREPKTSVSNQSIEGITVDEVETEFNERNVKNTAAFSQRSKNETAEEKRLRKQAVKMERKERRVEKKLTKKAFKQEEIRQGKELMNLRKNLQGIKMT